MFVALELARVQQHQKTKHVYRINLMRGTAHFIQYHDEHEAFGQESTDRMLAERRRLLTLKTNEQKVLLEVEHCLQDEARALNALQQDRARAQLQNRDLADALAQLQLEIKQLENP